MNQDRQRGKARITARTEVARGYSEIRLEYSDTLPGVPLPGRFFTILPPSHPMRQMRRPFAYSHADESGFSFIYEVRGETTRDIDALPPGSELDWIGPLGSAFPGSPTGYRPVLVAGGIGLGPVYYLSSKFASEGLEPILVIGARTAALVPELPWPEGAEIRICTDDGSRGIRGTALEALNGVEASASAFYTCGPHPMMAALHRMAMEAESPCFVSMEEMMACGVGACQGCAVEMAEPGADGGPSYKRACVEGPVFDSRELAW